MLTLRQLETLEFIQQFIVKHGYAPTTVEIAKGIGISSKGVVHRYIKALEKAGKLTTTPYRHRNIELLPEPIAANDDKIPLLGKIAAGQPIAAIQDTQTVDLGLLSGHNRYALRVYGNSMVDEGILDGDLVICEHCQLAADGAIVVALIDNECATLKRFKRNTDNTVTLSPANADYLPMIYSADRVKIQGIFVGLVRMGFR